MITAGIDCGAKNTKTVILNNGKTVGRGKVLTGFNLMKAVGASLGEALNQAGLKRDDIESIGGTGSGKEAIAIADIKVSDIEAMAKGAHFFYPGARTVTDIGAEEGRAAKLDEKGNPVDFAVNEKCAAGAGAFIEAMARVLEVTIEEMGRICLQSDKKTAMNAQCVIFAESEVVGLVHARTAKPDISKAILDSMASRIVPMIHQVGVNPEVVMIGGVAHNPGFMAAMRRELKLEKILIPQNPEFGAAIGAAVTAAEEN
jgi:benzoyl-CoA reductase subunit D